MDASCSYYLSRLKTVGDSNTGRRDSADLDNATADPTVSVHHPDLADVTLFLAKKGTYRDDKATSLTRPGLSSHIGNASHTSQNLAFLRLRHRQGDGKCAGGQ